MNSKKANIDNDDLKFIPLNIDSSLSPNGSKFPILYNLDGLSLSGIFGSISLELPNLNVSPIPLEMVDSITPVMAPLMPYPKNTPNSCGQLNSLYLLFKIIKYSSKSSLSQYPNCNKNFLFSFSNI